MGHVTNTATGEHRVERTDTAGEGRLLTASEPDPISATDDGDDQHARLAQQIVKSAADGLIVVDAERGTILYANPAAAHLFGRRASTLVGQQFGHPVNADGERTEIDVVRKRELLVVELTASSVTVDGRSAYVCSLRDVTARRVAEDALRDFVSTASHEFRLPLTSITGFAWTIRESFDKLDPEQILRYVGIIETQGRRMSRLADDLLSVARLESEGLDIEVRDVDLRKLIASTLETLPEMDVTVLAGSEITVLADPDRVQEILLNFLSNARKYGAGPYRIECWSGESRAEVRIVDHGDGVPVEFVNRLFTKFARARAATRAATGSGLGLSIVRGLTEAMGGDAWYEPNEPNGSRFCFSLPLAVD